MQYVPLNATRHLRFVLETVLCIDKIVYMNSTCISVQYLDHSQGLEIHYFDALLSLHI